MNMNKSPHTSLKPIFAKVGPDFTVGVRTKCTTIKLMQPAAARVPLRDNI